MNPRRPALERLLLTALGSVLVLFLAAPLVGLLFTTSLTALASGLSHPLVWPALELSLFTTSLSVLFVVGFGTPLLDVARSSSRFAGDRNGLQLRS